MSKYRGLLSLHVLSVLLVPGGLHAQDGDSNTDAVAAGADVVAFVMRTRLANGAVETPAGVGVRGQLSYGFNVHWAAYLAGQTVSVRTGSSESMRQGELGARYTFFDNNTPIRPYIEGGVAFRQIVTRVPAPEGFNSIRAIGSAAMITGGIQLFETRSFAFDLALAISSGTFRNPKVAGERVPLISGNVPSTAFRVGARYFFVRSPSPADP